MIDPFHTIIEMLEHFSFGNKVDPEKEKSIDAPFPYYTPKKISEGQQM